ncbi:hypothetical protein [Streptomyces sp. CRN 30]|uniref:hypothetical protein n=1 Tax=Streptomyces sp. CRN 30 TaxID=3075613 RepID=UPI002A7F28EC|nr:hypothetical protein [Streptomyces sp. CRN 30]
MGERPASYADDDRAGDDREGGGDGERVAEAPAGPVADEPADRGGGVREAREDIAMPVTGSVSGRIGGGKTLLSASPSSWGDDGRADGHDGGRAGGRADGRADGHDGGRAGGGPDGLGLTREASRVCFCPVGGDGSGVPGRMGDRP